MKPLEQLERRAAPETMHEQLTLPTPAEKAKLDAIEKVAANSLDFVSRAYGIIEALAGSLEQISALDVWARYDGPPPRHPRAMGGAFVRAQRAGLIVPTQRFIKSGRSSDHNQFLRVWRVLKQGD